MRGSWSRPQACTLDRYLITYQLRIQASQDDGGDTAANAAYALELKPSKVVATILLWTISIPNVVDFYVVMIPVRVALNFKQTLLKDLYVQKRVLIRVRVYE